MALVVVHTPAMCVDSKAADLPSAISAVVLTNTGILRGHNYHFQKTDVCALIGNPNAYLTEEACKILADAGVLSKTPDLDENGRQRRIKDEDPLLWIYQWLDASKLSTLTDEQIAIVAWELRYHDHFAHLSFIHDVDDQVALDSPTEDVQADSSSDSD